MGRIIDVILGNIKSNSKIYDFIVQFSQQFDIDLHRDKTIGTSNYQYFFIKPDKSMQERLGINQEILLLYSMYENTQARTIEFIKEILNEHKTRIEQYCAILVTEDLNIENWLISYCQNNPEPIIIPFIRENIQSNKSNNYYIQNNIEKYIWDVDLFFIQLPLQADYTYYYGRDDIINTFVYRIRNGENCGLFGLRKIGKTSLLNRLENKVKSLGDFIVKFYDCKNPKIRMKNWLELLKLICSDITGNEYNNLGNSDILDTFESIIKNSTRKILLIFDEVEYISFLNTIDNHWKNEFINFWQTIWSIQSTYRNVSVVVAGLNSYVVEVDRIDSIQNPLFGIIGITYLNGLNQTDIGKLIMNIGKRMGIRFNQDIIDYIYNQYGGHPLLTRIACSYINKSYKYKGEYKPYDLDLIYIKKTEHERDELLVSYCRHIVSELLHYYPDEYSMLEFLATGRISDFIELSSETSFTTHLYSYGVLTKDCNNVPKIAIPVLERYIGNESKRLHSRAYCFDTITFKERKGWVSNKIDYLIKDVITFENNVYKQGKLEVYGRYGLPFSSEMNNIPVVDNDYKLHYFLDIVHNSMVEPLKKDKNKEFFFKDFNQNYPVLFDALNRVNAYRNNKDHSKLDKQANDVYLSYLDKDLEGQDVDRVKDGHFRLQQIILDSIFTAIQIEISNLG